MKQLSLFAPQSLNVNRDFKECLARLVDESGLSRADFLDRLNSTADQYGIRLMKGNGAHLTMATFEKWLNIKLVQYMPPIGAVTVICAVSGSVDPLQIFANALGVQLIDEQQTKKLQWAEAKIAEKEARKRIRKLEADL